MPGPFDNARAVQLGLLVNAVYALFKPGDLTPTPVVVPPAFKFVAWVQMQDFSVFSADFQFYGVVVEEVGQPGSYVVAIRGTQGHEEWFDDVTALHPTPWAGGGQVGFGFSKIYSTLRIVDPNAPVNAMGAMLAAPSASFTEQVEHVTQRHMAQTMTAEAVPSKTLTVVGHSLGSALATLYASDNHRAGFKTVKTLCTFASPFVGDAAFAAAFDALGLTSWRIVNRPDLVPKLPPLEYQHVQTLELLDSGDETVSSIFDPLLTLSCWHSLQTYLHLLDPDNQPIESKCLPRLSVLGARRVAVASAPAKEVAVTVPPGQSTTINITINVGSRD